ncbi:hypothetical protein KC19_12G161800 [Ceratodon purpureus]|uniref:Secreted protein n=1 Tax=Ceratodon purpureus TaxID=3225 RepID=A0A8T0G7V3_CERPU|nr:hypothetical protein KC19_12G160700 [Ceratodon purpureus]KAG0555333.1 hypothetical protein KC19_12G161800 [Ceratodon purpureus]
MNPFLIIFVMSSLIPNALDSTSSLISGLAPNSADAISCTPGFCAFSTDTVTACPLPTFSWKCTRPTGNRKKSPVFSFAANSFPAVSTNPTCTSPFSTVITSDALGCVWGGTRPPLA